MAYDRQQIKLTALGYIGAVNPGSEIWSWGLHLSGDTTFDAPAALTALNMTAIDTAIKNFHQNAGIAISNRCVYTTLKAAALDVNGDYISGADPRLLQSNGTSGYAGPTAVSVPNQIALVVSLASATNIGAAVRGRFYVPCVALPVNTEGRLVTGNVTAPMNAAKTMLDAINTAANTGTDPAVLQLMTKVGTASLRSRAVTKVRVGDVLDTMRSRRNALKENYQTANLA